MPALFRLNHTLPRDPEVDAWLEAQQGELGEMARRWFDEMRRAGPDVCETMHDGNPTACIGDAAFAYVGVYQSHVNVGFFRGNLLPDPEKVLQGTGNLMRHVKLVPGHPVDPAVVSWLIACAYLDLKSQLM